MEKFVGARFNKGMPLAKLERIMFKNTSEEDEEKAKRFGRNSGLVSVSTSTSLLSDCYGCYYFGTFPNSPRAVRSCHARGKR